MNAIRTALLAAALVMSALPLSADIVLLTNGRTMKVAAYQADGDFIDLALPTGGKVTLPIDRVERIVDDEVVPEVAQAAPGEPKKKVFPQRSWRYTESSRPLFSSKFDKLIDEASRKFDIDAALVSAVIKAESDYNPRTVSRKGARGLMQLMPATAERFGVTNSFDPVANIYGGTRYLRWLLETFEGDADLAVAAYNAGEGNVWKYEGVPPFRETVNYIQRIARHFLPEGGAPKVASSK
jgi:Soluble lytic murein transglycosylase and related regulatory proteins (some contain LysM/invasin domains)